MLRHKLAKLMQIVLTPTIQMHKFDLKSYFFLHHILEALKMLKHFSFFLHEIIPYLCFMIIHKGYIVLISYHICIFCRPPHVKLNKM